MDIHDILGSASPQAAATLKPILKAVDDGVEVNVAAIGPQKKGAALVDALCGIDGPLLALRVAEQSLSAADLERLSKTTWFAGVRDIDLRGNRIGAAGLAALGRATELRSLNLGYIKVGPGLAKLPPLQKLETLMLGFSGIDNDSLLTLIGCELPALKWLDLMGLGQFISYGGYARAIDRGGLDYGGVEAATMSTFTKSDLASRLETLVLTHAFLDKPTCAALAAGAWGALHTLVLNETRVGDSADALVGSYPALRHLERDGGFGDGLAKASFLEQLTALVIPKSAMAPNSVDAVIGAAKNLTLLDLTGCDLKRSAADALAASTAPLRTLRVMNNALDGGAVASLVSAPFLSQLNLLGLSGNLFGSEGAAAVANSAFAGSSLGLSRADLDDDDARPLWSASYVPKLRQFSLVGNRVSDASVDAILGAPFENCTLDMSGNALTRSGFQKLAKGFKGKVTGERRQNPGRARAAPKLDGSPLSLVPGGPAALAPGFGKTPKRVAALGFKLGKTAGTMGWFVGKQPIDAATSHVILITKTGKKIEPKPPILIPGLRDPFAVVNAEHDAAIVFVGELGIYAVNLKDGASERIADATGAARSGIAYADRIVLAHGDTIAPATLDLFSLTKGTTTHAHRLVLEVAHRAVGLHRSGQVLLAGQSGFARGPLTFLCVVDQSLKVLGALGDGYTVVGPPLDALVKGGDAVWDLEGIDAALAAAT